MKNAINSLRQKARKGFSMVEIIGVVVLIGIFAGIGMAMMRDTTTTGRSNAGARNASELNNCLNNARAAGATWLTAVAGSASITQGTATTPAVINVNAAANAADVSTLIGVMAGVGILSNGNTASVGRSPTVASYTCANVNNWPTFSYTAGAAP